ncbi:MAG: sigma-70 family RNA polymerase sigma factor [Ignavibacteriae bacterium]|nr:sigma-70 family RNA polymerase sigma factor [Ignavibacteriota bacterium]
MNRKPISSITPEPQLIELDRELLAKAKSGDERAFTELVKKYEQMVYSFSFKVCRDKDDAEETLQDTFVNVFRKLKQFDGKSKFSTWLYSIVANNCLMKRRRSKLEQHSVSIEEPSMPEHSHSEYDDSIQDSRLKIKAWSETPLDEMMGKELRLTLDEAILKLPVDYRLVFLLRDVEGQSAEETAKIMKLTVPAVKSRLRRARVFLREQLNEYMTS